MPTFKEVLNKLIPFLPRQAQHERNQIITVRPELDENFNHHFLDDPNSKPRGANGLADLLLALAMGEGDKQRETALASLLYFTLKPEVESEKLQFNPITVQETPKPEPQPTNPDKKIPVFYPYHLVSLTTVSNQNDGQTRQEEASTSGILTSNDREAWDQNHPISFAQPIVPWSRLWPRLRLAVACSHPAGIDFALLTDSLAKGQVVRRLPKRQRLAWPNPLAVVFDFSDRLTAYWQDWDWLRQHLETSLHQQVRCYRLKGVPQNLLQVLVNGRPKPEFIPWPELTAGASVLLVSDLGMLDSAHPWPRQCWEEKLADYQRLGVKVIVLAPIANRHLQAELINLATTVRLSPDSSLRPLARLGHHQNLDESKQTLHPAKATLLTMMSVATRIEPGLLRELRRQLPDDGLDAGLEGEVWCHQELDTAPTACALAPWAVQVWREQFPKLPTELQQSTLACLRDAHARLPQAVHHEETLIWQALADSQITAGEQVNSQRARLFFRKLTNTLAQEGIEISPAVRALQVQLADRHVHWVAPTLSGTEPYLNALSTAIAKIEPERLNKGLSPGINPPAWLSALPPVTAQSLALQQLSLPELTFSLSESILGNGISQMATLTLDRPAVLWAWQNDRQASAFKPWYWQNTDVDNNLALPSLLSEVTPASWASPALLLHTRRHRLQLERYLPSERVAAWGQDFHGLFADLNLNSIVQRFRWIPPGVFMMGSPESEPERWAERETQHEVTLTQGYWLADTACTQALWQAVMGKNPSGFKVDPNHPVETVSWNDTQQFINRLNSQFPEVNARLPSEAEWEYACRAGTSTPFSFGDNITSEQVNYDGNHPYANGKKGQYRQKTVPVKSLPVNPWGLYEMHGNVWEWCQDWFGDYPNESVVNPTGADTGDNRVLRGGSWISLGWFTRSAFRYRLTPDYRNSSIGFRLALGRSGASRPAGEGGERWPDGLPERSGGGQAGHSTPDKQSKPKK